MAGKGLRSLQHIKIKGIFMKNFVCITCFWKDAMETGSKRMEWVSKEQRRKRKSVLTVYTLSQLGILNHVHVLPIHKTIIIFQRMA